MIGLFYWLPMVVSSGAAGAVGLVAVWGWKLFVYGLTPSPETLPISVAVAGAIFGSLSGIAAAGVGWSRFRGLVPTLGGLPTTFCASAAVSLLVMCFVNLLLWHAPPLVRIVVTIGYPVFVATLTTMVWWLLTRRQRARTPAYRSKASGL